MKTSQTLLTIPLAGSIIIHGLFALRHFLEPWPDHARFHLGQHIAIAIGLCIVGLVLIHRPFRQGQRWAWWALFFVGAFLYGSYWINSMLIGLGEPVLIPNTAQGILLILYTCGLILGWRQTRRGDSSD